MFQTDYKKITRILLIIAGILLVLAIILLQIIPKDPSLKESIKNNCNSTFNKHYLINHNYFIDRFQKRGCCSKRI